MVLSLSSLLASASVSSLLLLGGGATTAAAAADEGTPITCGSSIKLKHKESSHHLHSHPIAWGSGSSQQSVTAHGSSNDPNSMWIVKEGFGHPVCEIGTPVKCGSFVRLQHVTTGKNLHSHNFRSPLSGNQEVSGFGDATSGDSGDSWEVVCAAKTEFWERGKPVHLKHMDTGKWLSTSDAYAFTQQNCGGGCPIMGQFEVSASGKRDSKSIWYTSQGVYFPPHSPGGKKSNDDDIDDEL